MPQRKFDRYALIAAAAVGVVLPASPALAMIDSAAFEARLEKLEQELGELKQENAELKQENAANEAAAKAVEAKAAAAQQAVAQAAVQQQQAVPQVQAAATQTTSSGGAQLATLDEKGLLVRSSDDNLQLRLRGYVQADDRTFVGNGHNLNTDQFLIRTARPIVEAKFYNQFEGRLMMDFGGGQSRLLDAYGDYKPDTAFNLRAGKFKDPIGIERWLPEQNILFVERGMATNLVPFRDVGGQAYGTVFNGLLDYNAAITDGAPDLATIDGGATNGKDYFARLFAHPFINSNAEALKGLSAGLAGSIGDRQGSSTNTDITAGYLTPAQTKFFTYRSTVFGNGEEWRLNPQLTYLYGPFSALGEYVTEQQRLQTGGTIANLNNKAYTAETGYVLTGENARFDGVVPRDNFRPAAGQWGAFELVGRYSALYVDGKTFPTFADITTSAKTAHDATFGVNWYLNPNVKLNADYSYTAFEGGNTLNRDRPSEKTFMTRAQVGF